MKKLILTVLAAALILTLSACGEKKSKKSPVSSSSPKADSESTKPASRQTHTAEAQNLTLYPAAANLPVGRELKLKATLPLAGANAQWTSSDETVATVEGNGKVTAKAPGECTITVASDGQSAECTVWVKEECRTVIFAAKPIKGDSENPPKPPKNGGEGEPPIELPPDVTDVDENPEIKSSGGQLTDYTENDTGLQNVPITVEVTMMDDAAFHEVMVGHVPKKDRTITQQLPIPISKLFPDSMVALGEVSGMTTISGTMTIEAMGQSITAPFGTTETSTQPYTICIYRSGNAVLTFPLMARDGFDRNWVEGILTKCPLA